jgi:hypothetical protein
MGLFLLALFIAFLFCEPKEIEGKAQKLGRLIAQCRQWFKQEGS